MTILNSKLSFKWRKNLKKGLIQIEINVIKGIAKVLAKYNYKIYHIIRVIFLTSIKFKFKLIPYVIKQKQKEYTYLNQP